jgi:hypothetical protein
VAPSRLLRVDRAKERAPRQLDRAKQALRSADQGRDQNQTSDPIELLPARAGRSARQLVRLSALSAQTLMPDASID